MKLEIKQKAEFAKNTDRQGMLGPAMYPASTNVVSGQQQSDLLAGAVVPKGFEHYSHCVCYKPDDRFPRPTMELAELEMLSEAEARGELAKLCKLVR